MALQPHDSHRQTPGPSVDGSVDTLAGARVRLEDLPGKKAAKRIKVDRSGPNPFNVVGEFLYHLTRAAAIAILPATVAVGATVSMWVGSAVPGINAARSEVFTRETEYLVSLSSSQPLLNELESLGAPSDQLQVVYFAYTDAEGDDRRIMADTYLGILVDQATDARIRRGEAANRIAPMIAQASAARRKASEDYKAWVELLNTPRGRIAAWLGLVSTPSPGMEVYLRSHPRAGDDKGAAKE